MEKNEVPSHGNPRPLDMPRPRPGITILYMLKRIAPLHTGGLPALDRATGGCTLR